MPKPQKDRLTFTFHLAEQTFDRLKQLAEHRMIPMAAVCRQLIEAAYEEARQPKNTVSLTLPGGS